MKRLCVCVLALLIGISTTASVSADSTDLISEISETLHVDIPTDIDSSMVMVHVDRDEYYTFLQSPSIEQLVTDDHAINIVRRSLTDDTKIELTYIYDGDTREDVAQNGDFTIGYIMPLYTSFLDFVTDYSQLELYLLQHGVDADVKCAIVVCAISLPSVVWISLEDGYVFMTVDDLVKNNSSQNAEYSYTVYTGDTYLEALLPTTGTLCVNGETVASDDLIQFHNDYATVPLLKVFRQLGALTVWETNDIVHVFYDGDAYVLNLTDQTFIKHGRRSDMIPQLFGGAVCRQSVGDDLVLDSHTARQFFEKFDCSLSVDHSSNCVEIKGEGCYEWICATVFLIFEWITLLILFLIFRLKHPSRAKLIKTVALLQIVVLMLIVGCVALWYVLT